MPYARLSFLCEFCTIKHKACIKGAGVNISSISGKLFPYIMCDSRHFNYDLFPNLMRNLGHFRQKKGKI